MGLRKLLKNISYLSKNDLTKSSTDKATVNDMLDNLKFEIYDEMRKNLIQVPKFEDRFGTLKELIKSGASLARFGDGEFNLVLGEDIPFQTANDSIKKRLEEILVNKDKNILIGIPDYIGSLHEYVDFSKIYARNYWKIARPKIYPYIDFNKQYYDACITRPYINYTDHSRTKEIYDGFKKIWNGKDLVIVEGYQTRMGAGNDLFNNTKSVKRITCPGLNAYDRYDQILNACKKMDKKSLFLISLGPTATVLAYDLAKLGYQALDTGHLDIEYEWFLAGATERVAVKGKHAREAHKADKIADNKDQKYLSQIVATI
ncbi:MAG: SP_1767 family glycosyltransferase [Lactobacillus sp.]|jgi:glycosyltransferase family protein|nr:SP_1767 family glycosyltransferase [Lactobacillus sp.]